MKSHLEQTGTITDDDGPYIPGEDDCSWIIAPTGASRIHLTISKLELGGLDGYDIEELQIVVCQDIECSHPMHIDGSPFNANSPLFLCNYMQVPWVYPSYDSNYQVMNQRTQYSV